MKIKIKDLCVDIENIEIVKNVDLEIKEKLFTGIIGPNGAGKSTLLKTIYRVLSARSGEIILDNKNLEEYPLRESAKKMSVVSQLSEISFDIKVINMVLIGRSPYKSFMESDTQKDFEIARQSLKKVGMLEFEDRGYLSLSGGERQRVLLARALCQKTDLMILDEPTNHLDINHQINFFEISKKLNVTIFSAMHDLNLSAMYCDRLYAIKNGKIVYGGKTNDVLTEENIYSIYGIKTKITEDEFGILNIKYLRSR